MLWFWLKIVRAFLSFLLKYSLWNFRRDGKKCMWKNYRYTLTLISNINFLLTPSESSKQFIALFSRAFHYIIQHTQHWTTTNTLCTQYYMLPNYHISIRCVHIYIFSIYKQELIFILLFIEYLWVKDAIFFHRQ